jgi:4-hydroxy-3-methylbut-2-en-1-yl diphosphate reductase
MPVERVLLAEPRSFCAGVEMAIKALAWMLRLHDRPVYCYHEIVHNQVVVDRFRDAGVVFVDDVADVPDGAPLMLSAHGTSPEVVEAARAGSRVVVDAVCPLVKKVHHELQRRSRHGHVVYAGHARHDEAVGTLAQAPDQAHLVERPEDVAALDVDGPVSFLAQTTLAFDDWQAFLDATRERFDDVWVPARTDLCFATTNRQAAVKALAPRCDAVVVIGSTTSSNTLSLVKVAGAVSGARVLRVNGPDELPGDLGGVVGVTAGASAPDDVVHAVVDALAPVHGVEVVDTTEEDEYFPPPRELRELLRDQGSEHLLDDDRTVAASVVLGQLDPPPAPAAAASSNGMRPRPAAPPAAVELGAHSAEVDAEIGAVVDEEIDAAWLRGAIEYHLGWRDEDFQPLAPGAPRAGGKQLRATLALLAYRAAAGEPGEQPLPLGSPADPTPDLHPVLPLAAAVELLHNWSLVHDDIEDGDRTRRGRPALWALCGEAQAINVGDCMYALAFRAVARLGDRGVPDHVVGQLTAGLARAAVEITLGQMRDLTLETTVDVDDDAYVEMIRSKTAALLSYCTWGGALVARASATSPTRKGDGGSDDPTVRRLGDFGRALGLAFQVRDDVLGIWGDSDDTGKPTDGDIVRRKKTLPVVLALSSAAAPYRQRLHQLYGRRAPLTASEVVEVRQVLDRCGAQPRAQHWAEQQRAAALATLRPQPHAPPGDAARALDALATLADFVTHRTR